MFLYFGLMEFLQIAQYMVADQCDNPVNQWLTWSAFVHVAFQPLVINLFFLYGQVSSFVTLVNSDTPMHVGFGTDGSTTRPTGPDAPAHAPSLPVRGILLCGVSIPTNNPGTIEHQDTMQSPVPCGCGAEKPPS